MARMTWQGGGEWVERVSGDRWQRSRQRKELGRVRGRGLWRRTTGTMTWTRMEESTRSASARTRGFGCVRSFWNELTERSASSGLCSAYLQRCRGGVRAEASGAGATHVVPCVRGCGGADAWRAGSAPHEVNVDEVLHLERGRGDVDDLLTQCCQHMRIERAQSIHATSRRTATHHCRKEARDVAADAHCEVSGGSRMSEATEPMGWKIPAPGCCAEAHSEQSGA